MAYAARSSLADPQNTWSLTVPPRNVWKQNVLYTERSSTKRPAMKRLDQFDHHHNNQILFLRSLPQDEVGVEVVAEVVAVGGMAQDKELGLELEPEQVLAGVQD